MQTADCFPIILADRKRRAVGVFHAGWRGTVKRIVEKGVGEMRKHFKSDPRHIFAAIGPGVQSCCYEVGEELRTKFEAQFSYADTLFREVKESDPVREKYPLLFLTARAPGHGELPTKLFLDLKEANRRQLLDAGVPAKISIQLRPAPSCHTELLFSYRAEKGVTGRMMAAAGIRPVIHYSDDHNSDDTEMTGPQSPHHQPTRPVHARSNKSTSASSVALIVTFFSSLMAAPSP